MNKESTTNWGMCTGLFLAQLTDNQIFFKSLHGKESTKILKSSLLREHLVGPEFKIIGTATVLINEE